MATLNPTSLAPGGLITPTELTLTASDVIAWNANKPNAVLVLRNPTAGAVSPTITGSLASTAIPVKGYGNVSAASLALGSIAAGVSRYIPMDSRREFMQGVVTITGGTGLIATLLQP